MITCSKPRKPFGKLVSAGLLFGLVLAGCGNGAVSDNDSMRTVGFFEIVDIDVVRSMEDGFRAGMRDEGFIEGENVTYVAKNAQNETANIQVIANQFIDQSVDLVYALGTPVVQGMYQQSSDIPIIFGGMTDPVAGGVVESFERPGAHATGTSDLVPPGDHLDLLLEIFPDMTAVGTINNPSEANSVAWQALLQAAADERGIEVIAVPVANTNEVQSAVSSLAGRVDAIITTPDNTVESAIAVVIDTALREQIPLMVPKEEQADAGALIGMGVDYRALGVINGHQAARILRGEASTADTPVETMPNPITKINKATAEALGVTIPDSVLNMENVELVG